MSTNNQNNTEDQEIDLGQVIKSINGFIQRINAFIYNQILFLVRNSILIATLIIIGVSAGYYLDTTIKSYTHEIIVSPNIGGSDYLYSKVDYLSSKLNEQDQVFFKSIGIKNSSSIGSIKIEPILDIYNFVSYSTSTKNVENTQNFELVKLLAEEGSLKDVIKDKLTSKNYPNHKIEISSSGKINHADVIAPLLKFINTNDYYKTILKISRDNILIKIKKNEQEIAQIDSLLKFMSYNLRQNKNQNLIYNNENNQINPLFELKNSLINEIASQKINLENMNVFIKESSITTNIKNTKSINGKLKFILPFFFIFGFICIRFFVSFYKKQQALSVSK
ncbi:hypothetical protein [Flavobacterium sp.]|uniref:hypothetical protein n=1 Tax=Flavobacterium sp. TaxID=239 RepID=UPI0038FBE5AE